MNKIILFFTLSIGLISFSQTAAKFKIKLNEEFILDTLNYTGDFSPIYSNLEINDCNDFFTSGQPLRSYSFSDFSDSIQFEISDLNDQYDNFEVKSIRYGIDPPINYIYSNYDESLLYYYEPIVKVPLYYTTGQEIIYLSLMFQEAPNILSWYFFKIEKNLLYSNEVENKLIKIHPNPSTDYINIECPLNSKITITDFKGQEINYFEITSQDVNQTSINIKKLIPGIYFIKVNDSISKIVKQ